MNINYSTLVSVIYTNNGQSNIITLQPKQPSDITPYYVQCNNTLSGISSVSVSSVGLTIDNVVFDASYNSDGSISKTSNGTVYSFTVTDGSDNTRYIIKATVTDISGNIFTHIFNLYVSSSQLINMNPPLALGPQGLQGNQGIQGEQGPIGPKGDTGETGPQGPTGATGLTGPQGIQGVAGTDATVTSETIISTTANPTATLGDVVDDAISTKLKVSNISTDGTTFSGSLSKVSSDSGKITSDGSGNLTTVSLLGDITKAEIMYTSPWNGEGITSGYNSMSNVIDDISEKIEGVISQINNEVMNNINGLGNYFTAKTSQLSTDGTVFSGSLSKISSDSGKITSDGSGNITCASIIPGNGATGTYTSEDGKTITVTNGIITKIA